MSSRMHKRAECGDESVPIGGGQGMEGEMAMQSVPKGMNVWG